MEGAFILSNKNRNENSQYYPKNTDECLQSHGKSHVSLAIKGNKLHSIDVKYIYENHEQKEGKTEVLTIGEGIQNTDIPVGGSLGIRLELTNKGGQTFKEGLFVNPYEGEEEIEMNVK